MIYANSLLSLAVQTVIILIISIIFSVFSPLGIGFGIFSIIRGKTQNPALRKISLVFQYLLSVLTLIIGILIAIMFSLKGLAFYYYYSDWTVALAIIIGVSFVFALEIGIIIWEGFWLNKK